MRPNNPRIVSLEAEQKFGGYSFCQLGRYKGRKAKKQKRKARIGEKEGMTGEETLNQKRSPASCLQRSKATNLKNKT